ncbi:MAG: 2-hydroxyacid dehydrogenase [Burkholderiales bacterium]|nr:2-hydroxyacid dehydrogenase [Burkholderiales bacterium]
MPVELILTTRIPSPAQELLEGQYRCHRLYEAADRAAFLSSVGANVRGIATFAQGGVDAALIEALPKLEIISHYGDGTEKIDLAAARRRGVVVANVIGVVENCVADTVMGMMLNVMRRFPQADAFVRSGKWTAPNTFPPATALGGKTLGILGLGGIGAAVAPRALAFGMKVRYHNRRRKDVPYPYDPDPVTLAANCDVLVLALPGGPQTENMVNAAVLDALGPRGYLINVARGSVVDEPVLIEYLQHNRIAGAGLDTFRNDPRSDPRFIAMDNVVLHPHVGTYTVETRTAMAHRQLENLRLHFAGEPVINRVV